MGKNNRARRAAKKRRQSFARRSAHPPTPPCNESSAPPAGHSGQRAIGADDLAAALVGEALDLCGDDRRHIPLVAARLVAGDLAPVAATAAVIRRVLADRTAAVVRHGWSPVDLAEVTSRRLTQRHAPLLAACVRAETERHPGHLVADVWREQVRLPGPANGGDLSQADDLALALGLALVLGQLPQIPELLARPGTQLRPGHGRATSGGRQLARVRALLAKAESTEFPEEAEALSAKAQELISRYTLERLLAAATQEGSGGSAVASRRLWINAPYVLAKAQVVDAVAAANRCRSVVSDGLGFTTIVGLPDDLDAVELLATSLLVQADAAMLRAGRRPDMSRASRSTSFRRSFLTAYAARIRERLTEADERATTAASSELVPLLREHSENIEATVTALFPRLTTKSMPVGNWIGWTEGRAAADLATFDTSRQVGNTAG